MVVQTLVYTGLAWLSGSLPLLPTLPSPSVARINDVSNYAHAVVLRSSLYLETKERRYIPRRPHEPLAMEYLLVRRPDLKLIDEANLERRRRLVVISVFQTQEHIQCIPEVS
jgi:hypothetical protein